MSVNRNIFYTFFTQGPTLIMGLFINYFITKIIRADGRGVYAIFNADLELLTLFLGFTVTSAIVFYVANKRIATEKLLGIGILTTLFGIAGLLVIFFIFEACSWSGLIFPRHHNSLFHYAYLTLCFSLVMINSVINSIFQGKALFKIVNWVSLVNSCINFLTFGICFFVSLQQPGLLEVNHVLVISFIVFFINSCMWLVLYKQHINLAPVFSFNFATDIRPLFVFVSIGHLSHILSFFTYRVDFWILEHYRGVKELGYYAQSVGFAQMFWSITNPILVVLIPYLASQESEESKSHFKFYSRLNFTVVFIGLFILFILADKIFPLYGNDFILSVLPFRILCLGILMSCVTKVFATYIYSQNKLSYNLVVTIISFSSTILLDFLLIPKMGMIGASIATTLTYTLTTLVISYYLVRKFDLGSPDFFFLKRQDLISIKQKLINKYLPSSKS